MAPAFLVETRVDGFLDHPSAAHLLVSQETFSSGVNGSSVKCLSPAMVSASLDFSATVLHIKGGIGGRDELSWLRLLKLLRMDWEIDSFCSTYGTL